MARRRERTEPIVPEMPIMYFVCVVKGRCGTVDHFVFCRGEMSSVQEFEFCGFLSLF